MLTEQQNKLLRDRLAGVKQNKPKRGGKAKTYLNRADRDEAMVIAAMAGALDDIVDSWTERGRPGPARRAVKLARYWAYQALEEMLRGIDQQSVDALLRDVGQARITVGR